LGFGRSALEGLEVTMQASVNPGFWQGRSVFVTGHTGFKGGWLTAWLAKLGANISGFALPPNTTPSFFEATGLADLCAHREGDLRDADDVMSALQEAQPEVVFHLAAQPLVQESYRDPVGTWATNVMGTVNLLQAVRQCPGVRVVVVVTTDKCYENREWPWGYRETDALGGHDPYSSSKAAAEIACSSFRRSFLREQGVTLVTARAGNVIGGGDWASNRLVPDSVRAFAKGEPVLIRRPKATRPWQHVIEPLRGYVVLAQEAWHQGAEINTAFNFGPRDVDVVEVEVVMDRLVRAWGGSAAWELDPEADMQPHEAGLLKLDCSLAAAKLGWEPRLNLETGLDRTVEWYSAFYADSSAEELRGLTGRQIDQLGMP
jgi:CDP-glucose 4,6-dehydratase